MARFQRFAKVFLRWHFIKIYLPQISGKRDLVDRKEVGKRFHPKWRVELNTPKTDLRTLLLSWPLKQELLLSKRSTFCNNFSIFGKHHPPAILLNNIFFTKWEFRKPTNKPQFEPLQILIGILSWVSSHLKGTFGTPHPSPGDRHLLSQALMVWKKCVEIHSSFGSSCVFHCLLVRRELLAAQDVYFLNKEAWYWR